MSEVQNPSYKARCRAGLNSVKAFKAGTLVRATEITPKQGQPYTTYEVDFNHWHWCDAQSHLEEEIARQDPGVEMPIRTFDEAVAISRSNRSQFCEDVVRQLINEGRLHPNEAKELYDKYNNR